MPRIPTNVLSARLKELEGAGIVHRRVLPRPDGSVVYELTEYGGELEDVVLRLGLWGARSLGQPRPDDVLTTDSVIVALRALLAGELGPDDAVAGGSVQLTGDPALLDRFVEVFGIPPAPAGSPAAGSQPLPA